MATTETVVYPHYGAKQHYLRDGDVTGGLMSYVVEGRTRCSRDAQGWFVTDELDEDLDLCSICKRHAGEEVLS